MRYIELFAGIGGFRRSTELLNKDFNTNYECVGFSEIDSYALKTYEANYQLNGEVRMNNIIDFADDPESIQQLPDFDLILGGFPCQPFSEVGKQLGFRDDRGSILFSIREILRIKKPNFIVLENVRHIERHNKGQTLNHILKFFEKHGYEFIKTVILNTKNYNLPQRRSRIFIICSRIDINLEISEQAITDNFQTLGNTSLLSFNDTREILDRHVDLKYYLSEKIKYTILADGSKNYRGTSQIDLETARTLTATMVKMHRACQDNYYSDDYILNGFSHKYTDKEILYKTPVRKLTPIEALKLQGFDETFCRNALEAGVSEHQLYRQAGNALSVNTGYALLHYLFSGRMSAAV
ncbi:DNA (cytosine-5)-methyltransferase 1 [Spirosoma oryzae]|uniref:Cytosine-specific methyltransferase n=1 Tax=Spirosoma oryzae TaxID=1469603 RepID=A0A2T0RNM9_9BACT|nr:DNA (cytosine-5-)-methyltransferase [Spirosoma oryzae]PRY22730.1 DNA (cytosine-5)-methyltransferase 1 [Spirosoma oryzae]